MLPHALRSLLRTSPTIAPVARRSVLSCTGLQAKELLNGLLASSFNGGPQYSAFLHAQGRVLHDVFVYTKPDETGTRGYLIEYDGTPSEATTPLLSYLKRHVLRSKVKIRDVSEEYDVWALWGAESDRFHELKRDWRWAKSGAVEPVWDATMEIPWGTLDGIINDRRGVGMGRRMLCPKGVQPQDASTHDIAPSEEYILHRLLHGIPEGQVDIPPMQAFPMDSNLDVMGGLDFRKGCYVGQETTARAYYTGVIRKRILPVQIQLPSDTKSVPEFPPHLDIHATVTQAQGNGSSVPRSRGTGKLLSSTRGVGLALLRLEHVEGARRGELKLGFEVDSGEGQMTQYGVNAWWPQWWPQAKQE